MSHNNFVIFLPRVAMTINFHSVISRIPLYQH